MYPETCVFPCIETIYPKQTTKKHSTVNLNNVHHFRGIQKKFTGTRMYIDTQVEIVC